MDHLESHLTDTVLSKLPLEYQALDTEKMVIAPNMDKFVFCESISDIGNVQCDNRGMEEIGMHVGDRHVLRYGVIRSLLAEGQVKLI